MSPGVDRGDLAALRERHPFDIGIERFPGAEEQALLGEGVLGVEDDELRLRLLGLEVIGDQARPLVGAGRAAERIGRRRDDDGAAVLHRFELAPQQQRLLARAPGMRHALGRRLGISGQPIPADVDAGRQHQAVVGEPRAVGQRDGAALRIDGGSRRDVDGDLGGDLVVAELLLLEVAQPGNDAVAERAGGECRVRFDQRHIDARVDPLDEAGAACSAETAAHHHHAAARALSDGGDRKHCRAGSRGLEEFTPARASLQS